MNSKFSILYSEEIQSYIVFDNFEEPIIEATEYIRTLSSLNSKKNVAVALQFWFEFIDKIGLYFYDVEVKHISEFRDWIKTPPEYRDSNNRYILYKTPHITSSTWMQYQKSISVFYDKYVSLKFPNCKISFKKKIEYDDRYNSSYLFKEPVKITRSEVRAISIENYRKILDCCTNDRDKLMLELFYGSGIRRGELFNIDIRQFKNVPRGRDFPLFTMYIHDADSDDSNKQTKTGGREVRILTSLAERISAYIDNHIDGRVVNKNKHYEIFTALKNVKNTRKGDPLNGQTVSKVFKNAAIKAGFPDVSVHDTRHSYITNLETFGIKVKDLMVQTGHKNPKTLYRYRSHNGNMSEEFLLALKELDSKLNSRMINNEKTK